MIDHNRYQTFLVTSLVICGISILMFIYQNFIYERIEAKNTVEIFVSNTALYAYDSIKREQFNTIEIPVENVINGMITDFSQVEGQYLKHSLQPGEVLVKNQLTTDNHHEEGDLLIPIEGHYVSDIVPNDLVSVYVLRTEQVNNKIEYHIENLFQSKRIYRNGQLGINPSVYVDGEAYNIYIRVTPEELDAYYQALKSGELIIAKHLSDLATIIENIQTLPKEDSIESDTESNESTQVPEDSTPTPDLTPESNEPSQEEGISSNESLYNQTTSVEDRGQIKYTANSKDTWESIALKFKTTPQVLKQLNPKIYQIEEKVELIVPGT